MKDFLDSGKYLPKPLRDFHDAKDVFKTIHHMMDFEKFPPEIKGLGWINAQIYVIDVFLWWMAKRGYTLQKSRQKLPFLDMRGDIKARQDEDAKHFQGFMRSRR